MGVAAVDDFFEGTQREALKKGGAGCQNAGGAGLGGRAVGEEHGLGQHGHEPWPGGAVVIGGLAAGVFVTFIVGPEGEERVIKELAVAVDGEGVVDAAVSKGAEGSRDEEFGAGFDDAGAESRIGDGT